MRIKWCKFIISFNIFSSIIFVWNVIYFVILSLYIFVCAFVYHLNSRFIYYVFVLCSFYLSFFCWTVDYFNESKKTLKNILKICPMKGRSNSIFAGRIFFFKKKFRGAFFAMIQLLFILNTRKWQCGDYFLGVRIQESA